MTMAIEDYVDRELVGPLMRSNLRSDTTEGERWRHTLGVGAGTYVGRVDVARALVYSIDPRGAPSSSAAGTRNGRWLALQFGHVFELHMAMMTMAIVRGLACLMTHEAFSDWLWGNVLASSAGLISLGTLPAVTINTLTFAVLERQMMRLAAHSRAGLVTRRELSALVVITRRMMVKRAGRMCPQWHLIQGD